MNWLILTPEQQVELNSLNANYNDRQCTSLITIDGTILTNADKVGSTYWSSYQTLLTSLTPYSGDPIFAQTTE